MDSRHPEPPDGPESKLGPGLATVQSLLHMTSITAVTLAEVPPTPPYDVAPSPSERLRLIGFDSSDELVPQTNPLKAALPQRHSKPTLRERRNRPGALSIEPVSNEAVPPQTMPHPEDLPWKVESLDGFKQALKTILANPDLERKAEWMEALSRQVAAVPAHHRPRARLAFVASESEFPAELMTDELRQCFRVHGYGKSQFALANGEPMLNVGRHFLNMHWIETVRKAEVLGWRVKDDGGPRTPSRRDFPGDPAA
jgi:hypothetical protein